jgi:MarR family transcriptional regulator, transcriptional regulator for hemolysin
MGRDTSLSPSDPDAGLAHRDAVAVTPPPPPIGLGFLVHDVARLMRRRFAQRARERNLGLTRTEAAALLNVARQQGVSQAWLARQIDVQPIALAHVLTGLEKRGLVERRPHATDRRIRTVWLREGAYAMVDRIREVTLGVRGEALAGFSEAEREQVFDTLFRIQANLLGRACPAAESGSGDP